MKTTHRKAAKHKRKWRADPFSSIRVLGMSAPYTAGEQAHLSIPAHAALQNIITGKGGTGDLDTLGEACNTALVLSESVHPECVDVCLRAGQSIIAAKNRWRKFARVGFDGPGLQNVRDVLDLYDQYLQHITPKQHADALRTVLQRIERGQFLEEVKQ